MDPLTAPAIVRDLQKRMGLSTLFQNRPAPVLPEYVLPWMSTESSGDQAPATVGQLKMLFSFDLAAFPRFPLDTDGDHVSDAREYALHSNPGVSDTDGDGRSDFDESIDPATGNIVDFFNGLKPVVTVSGAFSPRARIPVATAGSWVDQPLIVKVTEPLHGEPIVNAPLIFTLTNGGGGLGAFPRSATEAAASVMEARTNAAGIIRLSVKTSSSAGTPSTFAFWTAGGAGLSGGQFTAWSGTSLDFTGSSAMFWLKPENQLTVEEGNRVARWYDPVSNWSAAAAGAARPLLMELNELPFLYFNGASRLDLGDAAYPWGAGVSIFTIALPQADRNVQAVNNNPGRGIIHASSGQKVLLAGETRVADAPFTYTNGTPSQVADTRYFSCYTQKSFGTAPYYSYNVPASVSADLDPGLATGQRPQARYDITPDAVASAVQNKRLRNNPSVTNFPLFSGKSIDDCATRMKADFKLRGDLTWSRSDIRTYTRRGGNPSADVSKETYYLLEGRTQATSGYYTFNPGLIGNVAPVLSLGANSIGAYQYHSGFGPCLGSATLPAAPASSQPRLISALVPSSGGMAAFAQGLATSGSSVAAAGGSESGYRFIGSLQDGTNGYVGTVGDILLVRGQIDATSRQVIEDRLASRYQLLVDRGAVSGGTANGLPDWWERALLGSLYAAPANGATPAVSASFASPAADPDGDTLTNAQEWILGTNPALTDSDGDGLPDNSETLAGSLTKANDPDTDDDGFPDGADFQPANPANGLADTAPANGRPDGLDYLISFPISSNRNPDTDGDGLSDLFEITVTRTSIHTKDSDGDFLPDKWEYNHNLNPLTGIGDHGFSGDPDGDGATNYNEYYAGLNPRNPSTTTGVPDSGPAAATAAPQLNITWRHLTREGKYDFSAPEGVDGYGYNTWTHSAAWLESSPLPGSLGDISLPIVAAKLDQEHPWPTAEHDSVLSKSKEGLVSSSAHGNYLPNPDCKHANISHSLFWLEADGPITSPIIRSLLRVTTRIITKDGVASAPVKTCEVLSATIPATDPANLATRRSALLKSEPSLTITQPVSGSLAETITEDLLPVEVRDVKDITDTRDDRVIENAGTVPTKNNGESDAAFWTRRNAYFQAQIPDSNIAWIDPHRGTGNTPDMPRLVGRIVGAPAAVKVKWRLEVEYLRGNGYRAGYVGDFTLPEDKVMIPPAAGGNPAFTVEMNGDQEWRMFESTAWQQEIAQRGFFGGTAKVFLWIPSASPTAPTEPMVTFRIGGRNPDPALARTFLNATGGTTFPYLYAIGRHETFGRVRVDGTIRFYNQFYTEYRGGLIGDGAIDMGWAAWSKGWPLYNLDRQWDRTAQVYTQNGPGGYGMYQLTLGPKQAMATVPTNQEQFITRRQIWNWQDNVLGAVAELQGKRTLAVALRDGLAAAYPQWPALPNEGGLSGLDAIVVTLYNGVGGLPFSSLNLNGKKRPTCWVERKRPNSTKYWLFRQNQQNYVQSINLNINTLTP